MNNDVFRQNYTEVSPERQAAIKAIKTKAQELYDIINDAEVVALSSGRENALAKTNLEQAIMWAVKGLTA